MREFFQNKKYFLFSFLAVICVDALTFGLIVIPAFAATPDQEKLYGVNMSGGEFGGQKIPGVLNTDYIYPNDISDDRYFAAKGLTLIRIPFLWERVQGQKFSSLSDPDIAGLEAVLTTAQSAGLKVILDMHNFGSYQGMPLTKNDAPAFADAWTKLAAVFKNYPALYGYELMNEPHDLPEGSDGWAYLAQAATSAIRTQDNSSWILVPGYNWQSAKNWPTSNPNLSITDPDGKLLYSAHQYFDSDGSGTYAKSYAQDGATPDVGVEDLQPFIDWLHAHNALGIITEYGSPSDNQWLTVDDNFLNKVENEPSLLGAVYWSAGPWWGNYPLSIEPVNNQDRGQMATVQKYTSHIAVQSPPAPILSSALIKTPTDKTVYIVIGDKKYGFASKGEFTADGYNFSQVQTVDPLELESLPDYLGVFVRPPGTNFKYQNSSTIYYLTVDNKKLAYSGPEVFKAWNPSYQGVITIPDSEQYADGGYISLPEGELFKGGGAIIYQEQGGQLRPFTSIQAFMKRGYNTADIISLTDDEINLQVIGQPIQ